MGSLIKNDVKLSGLDKKSFLLKTCYLFMKNKEGRQRGENITIEWVASWAVWGWVRSTLPGMVMNALQASSSPCSPQGCGCHISANHALLDIRPKVDERKLAPPLVRQTTYCVTATKGAIVPIGVRSVIFNDNTHSIRLHVSCLKWWRQNLMKARSSSQCSRKAWGHDCRPGTRGVSE